MNAIFCCLNTDKPFKNFYILIVFDHTHLNWIHFELDLFWIGLFMKMMYGRCDFWIFVILVLLVFFSISVFAFIESISVLQTHHIVDYFHFDAHFIQHKSPIQKERNLFIHLKALFEYDNVLHCTWNKLIEYW